MGVQKYKSLKNKILLKKKLEKKNFKVKNLKLFFVKKINIWFDFISLI
jgi:hypothetical protein